MKKSLSAAIVIAGTLVLTIGATAILEKQTSWSIDSRKIPVPAGASKELQESIMKTPAPDVAADRQNFPKNEAEWIAMIAKKESAVSSQIPAFAKQLSVSVKEDQIGDVAVYHVLPAEVNPAHKDHLFIHVHGGAYVLYGGRAAVSEAIIIAGTSKIPVISIDYRMPPKHPFPAAVNDVVTVYRHLLQNHPAKSMALGGTSAGGGLTLASTHKFIQLGLEVPGALFAGTPWADLTKTGDTQFTNEGIDRVLITYDGLLHGAALLYAGEHNLKDPLISPVYGNFQGFPPTYMVSGTRDLFLSDTIRTHRKMRIAGVIADLNVYEGISHADYASLELPESKQVFKELNAFLIKHL